MSAGVEDIIKNGLSNLIQLPTGCGEQTMIRMAPLVYVLRYLYSMKDGVTANVERKAYEFMRKGMSACSKYFDSFLASFYIKKFLGTMKCTL